MSHDSTDWTQLHIARTRDTAGGAQAFGLLVERYRHLMLQFVLSRYSLSYADAEELVQQFILDRMIEQNLLAHADRKRGKFRAFLVTVLNHYLIDSFRAKRLPVAESASVAALDAVDRLTPVDHFERLWAEDVLGEALAATASELIDGGKEAYWKLFHARVVEAAYTGAPTRPYDELVAQLGFESPRAASNALVTAKRTFVRCLLRVTSGTETDDPEQLIAEVFKTLRHRAT